MILPFNVRGFPGSDPLDRLSTRSRYLLAAGITAAISAALVYVIGDVIPVVDFHGLPMKIAEVLGFSLVAAPLVVSIRRTSSLLITAMLTAPLYALDLFLQSHYRDRGLPAIWDYLPGTFITAIDPPALRFLLTLSFDGLVIGPVCLWLARIAAAIVRPAPAGVAPDEPLFPEAWTDEAVGRPPRDAPFWILRILAFAYLVYLGLLLLGSLGASPWPQQLQQLINMTYGNPYLAVDTVAKISLMIMLAFVAAFNRPLRWTATLGLCLGHVMSVAGSLFFYFYALDRPKEERDFLLASAGADAAMVLLFIWILIRSARDREPHAVEIQPNLFSLPVTIWRLASMALAGLASLHVVGSIVIRLSGKGPAALVAMVRQPDPTLCNSLTLGTTVAILALLMVKYQELRDVLTTVLGRALAPAVLFGVVLLAKGPVVVHGPADVVTPIQGWFIIHLLILAAVVAALSGVRSMFYNVEYVITSFRASSARAIVGMHDALFDPAERSDVLQAIDRYAGGIRGRKRGLLNFPFGLVEDVFPPLLGLCPPFSTMSWEERKYFLRSAMIRPERERRRSFTPELAEVAHDLAVAAESIILLAVYAGVAARARIGYVPPGARKRMQDINPGLPPDADPAPLPRDENDQANWATGGPPQRRAVAPRVSTPVGEPGIPDVVDYLVIGSGPGGAVMAYRLACGAPGASIAVIERGGRFSPRDDFSERELDMLAKLYKEGGIQQTKRADMLVLQGECVGGGSVINNAVCYRMPGHIQALWASKYGLALKGLGAEYDRTALELGIGPLSPSGINRRVETKFRKAVEGFNAGGGTQLSAVRPVDVNGPNALGDGLWNLGNKYFGKRTVLETYVPWAEARGVSFVPNVTAVDFTRTGGKATSVLVRTISGRIRQIRVRKAVVVSAGVISSSHFLMRSRVAAPVGVGMSCNFALPVALEFQEDLDAFDGEQITLGAIDSGNRAIFETYINPPGAHALTIPFYFDRHRSVMDAYRRVAVFGALVGSESNGLVEPRADLVFGQAFSWTLGTADQANIRFALDGLLKLGFAAGARRAIVPTRPGVDLPLTPANIAAFGQCLAKRPLRTLDLLINSAHPQGGNAMIDRTSPLAARRVVDECFRVAGCDNVFVADASVFPTSITVNPQWTIMALSSLASQNVLALCP